MRATIFYDDTKNINVTWTWHYLHLDNIIVNLGRTLNFVLNRKINTFQFFFSFKRNFTCCSTLKDKRRLYIHTRKAPAVVETSTRCSNMCKVPARSSNTCKVVLLLLIISQTLFARVLFKDAKDNNHKILFGKNYVVVPVKKLNTIRNAVSRFPPVLEFFVQMIQKYFSNYVYEDLSRPPTWDSPNFGMDHSQFSTRLNKTRIKRWKVTNKPK